MTVTPLRPAYHFRPADNWINDPNGLIEWNGRFHLFYQRNSLGPYWERPSWGHAVSDDLVRWEHLPDALTPGDGLDRDGCFSGCTVDDNGVPMIVYTAARKEHDRLIETTCIARGSDGLLAFEKLTANPVVGGPPAEIDSIAFRDPFVDMTCGA